MAGLLEVLFDVFAQLFLTVVFGKHNLSGLHAAYVSSQSC